MITIIAFEPRQRDALLELALRAWEPVFPLMKDAVPRFVYESFYPEGWQRRQRDDLAALLDGEPENIDVAVDDGVPVGWVCSRLHPEDTMGEIHVLVVDPRFQHQGTGQALMRHSMQRARAAGMRMVMVETGDDPGHSPARRAYEAAGFQRWRVARYFAELAGPQVPHP